MAHAFVPALALLGVVLLAIGGCYALARLVRVTRAALDTTPFLSGNEPQEHAVSRFHARWYALTMVFLAFDMEMLFMYPWSLVVRSVGSTAVIEMFTFLAILLAGVVYAWREGALRWS